eukprot:jgi/Tetstr1/435421/TSEL_024329.t1
MAEAGGEAAARADSKPARSGPPLTWFEFALKPGLLDGHLAALDAGSAAEPSVEELIGAFLDQVMAGKGVDPNRTLTQWAADIAVSSSVLNARATLLLKLAARACLHAGMSLQRIEAAIPPKLQPPLLAARAAFAPESEAARHKLDMARWVLRRSLAPPLWPTQPSGAAPTKATAISVFSPRSGMALDPPTAHPLADERVGGVQVGAVFKAQSPSPEEVAAAAEARAALAEGGAKGSAAAAQAAAGLELAEWLLGRGRRGELDNALSAAEARMGAASREELAQMGWKPPSSIGATQRLGDPPRAASDAMASQLAGLRLAAAATAASSGDAPAPAGVDAGSDAPQRLLAMAAARKRGDVQAVADLVLGDMEAAAAGRTRALPQLYIRSLLNGRSDRPEEPRLVAACCVSLALSTRNDLELLALVSRLQASRRSQGPAAAAFQPLLSAAMAAAGPAFRLAEEGGEAERAAGPASGAVAAAWTMSGAGGGAANGLAQRAETPDTRSSEPHAALQLQEALEAADVRPRPEATGTAARELHEALEALHAASRGEDTPGAPAAGPGPGGDRPSLAGALLHSAALRCASHLPSLSPSAAAPPLAEQARALFRAAAARGAPAPPGDRPGKRPRLEDEAEDGEMEGGEEDARGVASPQAWFDAWAGGCPGLVASGEAATPGPELLSSAGSVSAAPPALLCGVLAQAVDAQEWGALDGMSLPAVRARRPPERVASLVESAQLLSALLQAHSPSGEAEGAEPDGNALQASADKVFAALARVGTARSQVKEKYIGASSLALYPKGVLALRPSVATEMRSIIACLCRPAHLRVLLVALSVWLLHLVKPSSPEPEPLAERFGPVAAMLSPLYPPHMGLQGLGTRAAAFVAAEVRAMLQAAIQRFLLMAGDSGSPPPWPQRQPCLLQLADLEVERKDHRRALDLFCQVAKRVGITGLHSASIRRMAESLQAMGRPLPAAAVLQTLSPPDVTAAMQLLHPTTPSAALAMTRDAAFLECFWEVGRPCRRRPVYRPSPSLPSRLTPALMAQIRLLEVLVQRAHALKADNIARVKQLIQRPTLNFHNPPEVRKRAIEALQSRLLSLLVGLVVGTGVD